MNDSLKKYYMIGCCGIDCGLCPRFYTKGDSVCPGCGGVNFAEKHPSCGFITCCVKKRGFEVCSECKDYPCKKFDSEEKGFDSFVTHKKVFPNLDYIKNNGIDSFIAQQRIRMDILSDFLSYYDNNRSKSFFCLSCSLLPLDRLIEAHEFITGLGDELDIKEKNNLLREKLLMIADNLQIVLKLNKK
jgi:hypothetical protein